MKKVARINWFYLPLAIWMIIIPNIVKLHVTANPLNEYAWYPPDSMLGDFFLYWKAYVVTATGICVLLIMIWQYISNKKSKHAFFGFLNINYIPILAYTVLVVLSTAFSEHIYFGIHGMPEQYETLGVLLAYVLMLFYALWLSYMDSDFYDKFMNICVCSGLIIGVICTLQFFKIDIYRLIYSGDNYSFSFELGQVYGPFYNINYVGSYVVLMLPIMIALFVKDDIHKHKYRKMLAGVTGILLLIALYGSDSSTGLIAAVAITIFGIWFIIWKFIRKNIFRGIYLALSAVLIVSGAVCIRPYLDNYLQASNTQKRDLQYFYTHDDCVEMSYRDNIAFLSMNHDDTAFNIVVEDTDGNMVAAEMLTNEEGYSYYEITDDRFQGIEFMPVILEEDPLLYGFKVTIPEMVPETNVDTVLNPPISWIFTNEISDDGKYYYRTNNNKYTTLDETMRSESFHPLDNYSSLANGRGYIWNKTIALLNKFIVLGSGADTFAIEFPNGDYVDMSNNGYTNLIITKPHNLYLQIAVQSGVLSCIAFLLFYILYFIDSWRIYYKSSFREPENLIGFAVWLAITAYMISGIANDSSVTVAPVFWALMGIGIGINVRQKKQLKPHEKVS